MRIYKVRSKVNGGYVRTWKQVGGSDGHIEVIYSGLDEGKTFSSLPALRMFIQHITFNNADHCDIDDLEIVTFEIGEVIPAGGQ